MAKDFRNFFEEQRKFYDDIDRTNKAQAASTQENNSVNATTVSQATKSDGVDTQFEQTKDIKQSAQTFKNLANYYSKNGEDKLISDIFSSVKAQKAAGTLSNAQISQFAKSVSPMLNNEQREKLAGLVKQLLDY